MEFPTLAQIQAGWPIILSLFRGPAFQKMLLARAVPDAMESGVVRIRGFLQEPEIARLQAARGQLESLLSGRWGVALVIRVESTIPEFIETGRPLEVRDPFRDRLRVR